MKRLLILFANGFPYGIGEPFLEKEYPLYREYFDHVLISTACKRDDVPTRKLSNLDAEVMPDYTLSKDRRSILEALPWLLTDKVFYSELKYLLLGGRFSVSKLQHLIAYTLCANHRAKEVYQWVKLHPEYNEVILYSYWMHISAYAAERLNRKLGKCCFAITRAHGGDLYLERGVEGYHPFHEHLYRNLDEIAVISEQGKRYLSERYGDSEHVTVHRLGALDQGMCNPFVSRDVFRIVTCSRTIPLKRLDRLVDALSMISYPIHWTHLGGGESQESLERYASEKLPSNVQAEFYGTVPNTRVYDVLASQPFHVFVNISSTEGVPVSIMEAMSFHIPVIATDVGGTSELVDDGENGILLLVDFSDEELVDAIGRFHTMPQKQYMQYRENARIKFEKDYNAIENYKVFLEHLACKQQIAKGEN